MIDLTKFKKYIEENQTTSDSKAIKLSVDMKNEQNRAKKVLKNINKMKAIADKAIEGKRI